ncbi:MAG: hypothetical protein O7F76_04180 [Planctomycetota bacterium]|nr:hypothetical protein [Planctomycetota bacterium]
MDFRNSTQLDGDRLERMFLNALERWPHDRLRVFVRYSRGAEYSGTCFYRDGRIYVNLGPKNRYPFRIETCIARARSNTTCWWRESYGIEVGSPYELVLFVFLHEVYHWLVRLARRNVRQKESRCDRFAVRRLVERYGAVVTDRRGRPVDRQEWDFQDLDGFVAAARRPDRRRSAVRRRSVKNGPGWGRQLMLF